MHHRFEKTSRIRIPLMRKFLASLSAAAAIAAVSAPAMAEQVTIRVSAAGIDLSDAAGVELMKERIDLAVSKACESRSITKRYGAGPVQECVADGKAKALAALGEQLAPAD